MRGAYLATTAALMGFATADVAHLRHHGHDFFHQRREKVRSSSVLGVHCDTSEAITYGSHSPARAANPQPTIAVAFEKASTPRSIRVSTVVVSVTPITPSSAPAPSISPTAPSPTPALPTPVITGFSSTGIYTVPAATVTVTGTTTVCGAAEVRLSSGTNTYGGVTTVVETATTVACPIATVKPTGSTVTSVIETTAYICPTPGIYTIAPTTTFAPTSTVKVYPALQTITPGIYSHKRQTMTVTRTDSTYICSFTGAEVPPSSSNAQRSTSSTDTSSAVSTSTSRSILGGVHIGIAYSPFNDEGGCKLEADILAEIGIAKKKGFTYVRVYSTDCESLNYVGKACALNNLQMVVGVFIDSTGIQGAQKQVDAIAKWAKWDLVTLIVVGNEAVLSGYVNADSLAGFIKSARRQFVQAGYHGDVTTAEPINVWMQNAVALCPAVDVLGANVHPFFNPSVNAEQAGEFVKGEIDVLHDICNKKVINLETGWPSNGSANGQAVPSKENQMKAVTAIQKEAGDKSVFFSYSNEMWKTPGPLGVEQYWGCMDAF